MWRRSITLRLTLLFATASTVVLRVVGSVIGVVVEAHFAEQDLAELSGKLELIRHALAKVRTPAELSALPQQLDDALVGHAGLSVAVVRPDGQRLFATSGADFPAFMLEARALPTDVERLRPVAWERGEHTYSGIAATAVTGIAGLPPFHLAIALDIGHHREFMQVFHKALWLSVAFGILLAGVLGWIAAHWGLAPVRRIAEVAKGISASKLNDRLPLATVPTELLELAESFNDMLSRLEDAFHRLTNFSSDIAHELRAPVSNLMTQTQVALSRARTQDEYRDILSSNLEEYERLARMISDMLFLAKADHGLIVPQREPIDLATEVRELIEFYEPLAEESEVGLALHGAGEIQGDRLMMRRALSNLLSNALRHTPRGGTVAVTLDRIGNGDMRIRVENPGTDIAASHLDHLFDRFYRVDPAREHGGEGAGLGLAITKSIIEAHAGRIAVASTQGNTVFEMVLPIAPRKPEGSAIH
ncbi:MAG: heavy metal sensor histidine kinase [Gammaproteobacteria bacterium]|nr:heavy metal sensor histidine kinase [Gammaproteobacteria bacterium]